MSPITATAISRMQLCQLADLEPNFLSRHHVELPATVPLHDGRPGRPELGFAPESLVEFSLQHTGHLSEAEVRLRLAIALTTQKRHRKTAGFCAGATDPITGQVELVRIYAEPSLEPQP